MLYKLQAGERAANKSATAAVPTAEDGPVEFDLLIVGGGATGSGIALDAASRGLKVALVERDDFSSGEFFCRSFLKTPTNDADLPW